MPKLISHVRFPVAELPREVARALTSGHHGPPAAGTARGKAKADIFVSYTSSDKDWAFWIGQELEALGHVPHIHEWEISGGANTMAWVTARTDAAAHVHCVVSEKYLKAPYSSLERTAAEWAAVSRRPNFAVPVFVEPC